MRALLFHCRAIFENSSDKLYPLPYHIYFFFYFIEPLNNYGRLIINFLLATISLTFFYSLVFLASSKFLDLPAFANYKILVMIGAFSFVNSMTLVAIIFILIKSANAISSPIMKVINLAEMVA